MNAFPPKKILVPVALDELSMTALEQADSMAETFGASLEVLHVRPLPPVEGAPYYWDDAAGADWKRDIVDEIRDRTGTQAPIRVLQGVPVAAILHEAHARRPDLLVMGTHGRKGIRHALLGSTTESVVRWSPVPTLVVHGEPWVGPVRSILAPVNFTPYSDRALLYAARLAAYLKARLSVIHATRDMTRFARDKARLTRLVDRLPPNLRAACLPENEIVEGPADDVILERARERDLLVLAVHRRGAVRDFVFGTTAERLLRRCPTLVLTVPPMELSGSLHRERWFRGNRRAPARAA